MTPDDPRHGTTAGYNAHRKRGVPLCEPCRDAKRRYARRREKERNRGNLRLVPTTLIRKHIQHLMSSGMSRSDIARAAGVSTDTVTRCLSTEVERANLESIQRLAAVRPAQPDFLRPALGYRRRLQALFALGHSATDIAARSGISHTRISDFVHERKGIHTVHLDTALAIEKVYEELSMTTGSSVLWRKRAARKGWPPPLAYDDIDDPNETPNLRQLAHTPKSDVDEAVVLRVMAGERLPMTTGERVEVVARLRARGWSLNEIETRCHIGKPERYLDRGAA